MKKQYLMPLLTIIAFSSCKHETKVMEETYKDGSPKKECVYLGRNSSREMVKETTWYPGKKLQMVGEFKDMKRDGKWIYYYENGNVWSEGFFKDGKSDGKRITYYENGKEFYEGNYNLDKRVGVWKFFDEKGKLIKTIDYSKEPENTQKPPL